MLRTACAAAILLTLSGCAITRPRIEPIPELAGPFAIPFADSVDVAWAADTSAAPPSVGNKPKPKKKSGTPAPTPAAPAPTPEPAVTIVPPKAPGAGEAVPPDPKPPQLTVRLSAEETVRLDEKIVADLARAERALAAMKELRLNGEPADQVAAARRFLADARAARTAHDYLRGAELAEKARVLAEAVRSVVIK